ncbi:MAG: hypothetical protein KIS76_03820 [Pyrinomonadaceae bacterium]|nr:hypothetical protein [Pyrinomonadaceae bacterium]
MLKIAYRWIMLPFVFLVWALAAIWAVGQPLVIGLSILAFAMLLIALRPYAKRRQARLARRAEYRLRK